ncbi:holo-ACP synthase [Oceanicaulis sp. MMSF_3324]|uniref:holo-ACP synthase n=1 Tax=Oceanicaulis sp. MMSF_3324 TaxID=3046702 RepID=UPI00273E87EF|nr:holo-ACP synthase [Oceanicaulis sp. MMSF_3324]
MILGVGSDLTDIRRIDRAIGRFGARFLDRIYTQAEQARAEARPGRINTYAKRFAAKEACAKAIGGGLWRGVSFTDIEVMNLKGGKPTIHLSGEAQAQLMARIPEGRAARFHVTMSDEPPYAQAFVVIEAVDPGLA